MASIIKIDNKRRSWLNLPWVTSVGLQAKIVKKIVFAVLLVSTASTYAQEPIRPIPAVTDVDPKVAALGKELFFEKRLSKDGTFSCHTCHLLDKGGVDLVPASLGGRFSKRNSPTIYNVRHNFKQLWDGRAETLMHQLDGLGPFDWEKGQELISKDEKYKKLFNEAFGQPVSIELTKQAIVEYEKTLVTPNSPFDQFLLGNEGAISEQAKQGYKLFKEYGCISCHQGINVGGNIFQKFGLLKDIQLRKQPTDDFGRFNVTKNEWDKFVFKVPSLRMAVHTPPYFHDGSVETIEEAVGIMIEFQLHRRVPDSDRDKIIEFLKTLPGEIAERG